MVLELMTFKQQRVMKWLLINKKATKWYMKKNAQHLENTSGTPDWSVTNDFLSNISFNIINNRENSIINNRQILGKYTPLPTGFTWFKGIYNSRRHNVMLGRIYWTWNIVFGHFSVTLKLKIKMSAIRGGVEMSLFSIFLLLPYQVSKIPLERWLIYVIAT